MSRPCSEIESLPQNASRCGTSRSIFDHLNLTVDAFRGSVAYRFEDVRDDIGKVSFDRVRD